MRKYNYEVLRNIPFGDYYYICDPNDNVVTDEDGNTIKFNNYDEAKAYADDLNNDESSHTTIEVELMTKSGKHFVYISNDGSLGVKYEYKSKDDLKNILKDYVDNMFDDESKVG